jgi:hypothetical protein
MHKTVPASAIVAVLLIGLTGCTGAPSQRPVRLGPVNDGQGSVAAARTYLLGRWSLESFEVYPPGKAPIVPKGTGTLVYDDFGNLTIEIRADQAASDLLRASGIDIRDGVISSSGRTAVDMQNRTLTYVIAGQSSVAAGPLATGRPRHWQVEGTLLTLTTQDDAGKPLSVAKWRKAS